MTFTSGRNVKKGTKTWNDPENATVTIKWTHLQKYRSSYNSNTELDSAKTKSAKNINRNLCHIKKDMENSNVNKKCRGIRKYFNLIKIHVKIKN